MAKTKKKTRFQLKLYRSKLVEQKININNKTNSTSSTIAMHSTSRLSAFLTKWRISLKNPNKRRVGIKSYYALL